jgi:phosphate transport system protein
MERNFDLQLKELKENISRLYDITNRILLLSEELITGQNLFLGQEIIYLEKESDQLETELQKKASTLMALHQPVARDLRLLLSSMNIAHELERIADQGLNIWQRMEESQSFIPFKVPPEIYRMIELVKQMLTRAVEAYRTEDLELAKSAIRDDHFLDDLKLLVTNKYLEQIKKKEINPVLGVTFILLSRHLEKMGDLAKNVAEEAYYLIKGEFIKHLHPVNRQK